MKNKSNLMFLYTVCLHLYFCFFVVSTHFYRILFEKKNCTIMQTNTVNTREYFVKKHYHFCTTAIFTAERF